MTHQRRKKRRAPTRPRVSVVMPVYNREREIAEAIDSVLDQTYDDLELIVVDDGSSDQSGAIIRGYRDRLRYLRFPENRGVAAARNAGLERARGELVAYADSDDIQRPYRIATQVAALDACADTAMVFSDFSTYTEGRIEAESHLRSRWLGPTTRPFDHEIKRAFPRASTCRALGLPVPEPEMQRSVYFGRVEGLLALLHVAWGCSQLARIDRVRAVGGQLERVRSYEDWALACELSKRWPLAFVDAPLLLYRRHPGQLTGRPRLNVESYRDVIVRTWLDDDAARVRQASTIAITLGTAHAQLGEIEAHEGRFDRAEAEFLSALRAHPRILRAYPNLALSALKRRVPLFRSGALGRLIPTHLARPERKQS